MYTNSQYKEDLRILKKAKGRVRNVLLLCAAAVCLYPAAVFMLLEQPLFTRPDFFNLFYLGSMLAQMVIWLLLFYFASTGVPASRAVFRSGVVAELGFAAYLVFDMFRQMNFVVVYLAWLIMLLIKIFFLWRLSTWLYSSYWARIYYDHVLTLPASMKPEAKSRQSQQPAVRPRPAAQAVVKVEAEPDFSSPKVSAKEAAAKKVREEKAISARYPRTAIRILVFVLAEMVVFPILVHIFANSFASIDNSSVFADHMEFTYCIITTVLWTLPVFFLYLKSPGCRKIVWFTLLLQILVIAFESWQLFNYTRGQTVIYSARVYLQFAMVELARYAILLIGVAPAFKLPEIQETYDRQSDQEDDSQASDEEIEYEIHMIPDDVQANESGDQENPASTGETPASAQTDRSLSRPSRLTEWKRKFDDFRDR